MLKKNIPAILFAGMFFFSGYSQADRLALATDLFEKGEWQLCRRECRRALLDGTEPTERFQLLHAASAVRNGMPATEILPFFEALIESSQDPQISAVASYEMGRLQWQLDHVQDAFLSFTSAFHSTTNKELFLHAACSLFLLMDDHKEIKTGQEDLISQINTSRDQWYGALFSQCGKPNPLTDKPESPGWFIGIYRTQISPAIGDRCNLEPSCSEYFHQAACRHGILAVPMMADRFFREPEVNQLKADPVIMADGQIRYRDPVGNHDFWMKQ